MTTLSELEREMRAMELDRNWANEVRKTVATVRSYPDVIFYSVDEQMRACAEAMGADMWTDTLQSMVNGLRELKHPTDFLASYGDQIYGLRDWDMVRFTIAEKYDDIYSKFHVNNNVPFAYRLSERRNLSMIVFEKISDLEVMEYALHYRRRNARGISAGVFPSNQSANIADFNWGGASSHVIRSIWTGNPKQPVPRFPASSSDF